MGRGHKEVEASGRSNLSQEKIIDMQVAEYIIWTENWIGTQNR